MPVTTGRFGPLVGAIDEGTSSTRFLVFSARTSEVIASHQMEISKMYPQEGWVEQDPIVILDAVKECIQRTVDKLREQDVEPGDIVAIGVTNQRETTILWDSTTGKPLYNAVGELARQGPHTCRTRLDRRC
ncbi:unnamed protein product [Timema podura]|uniref:Carbohydrate kinase FGGY N-terminal domain-containing protein n=1 Tax=Timema podura TaxID=61482 RepID=A0ABN7NKT1_TIMPD|nr:unnamed protein product [Timema podura]